MTRNAHFDVDGYFPGGARRASVTITDFGNGKGPLLAVRPHRERREYVLPLYDVALIVQARVVKQELKK